MFFEETSLKQVTYHASHKLSTVVTFRGRDLVMPKGIDGGEMLAWASADELLAHHLELASDNKAFWKDGFLLYTLWAMGDFCEMIPHRKRSRLYPYTRSGFYQFLRDHGSQISPEEGSRRIKVFRAYNRFGVTIIRMVEKAGINKAFAAIPYVQDDNIRDVLQLCIETPYQRLRNALREAYHQSGGRHRGSRSARCRLPDRDTATRRGMGRALLPCH